MSEESYLSGKLRNFTFFDLVLVQFVYLLVGLFIFSIYPRLSAIQWWFYLILTIIAAFPIYIHFMSAKGDYMTKAKAYVKSNNPAFQVLLFLSLFFFACLLSSWFVFFLNISWWYYIIAIVVLAIKPMRANLFW